MNNLFWRTFYRIAFGIVFFYNNRQKGILRPCRRKSERETANIHDFTYHGIAGTGVNQIHSTTSNPCDSDKNF